MRITWPSRTTNRRCTMTCCLRAPREPSKRPMARRKASLLGSRYHRPSGTAIALSMVAARLRIEREVYTVKSETTTTEITHCLTSLGAERASPEDLLALVRNHWQRTACTIPRITYDEDRCRVRVRNLAPVSTCAARTTSSCPRRIVTMVLGSPRCRSRQGQTARHAPGLRNQPERSGPARKLDRFTQDQHPHRQMTIRQQPADADVLCPIPPQSDRIRTFECSCRRPGAMIPAGDVAVTGSVRRWQFSGERQRGGTGLMDERFVQGCHGRIHRET